MLFRGEQSVFFEVEVSSILPMLLWIALFLCTYWLH